MLDPFFFLIDLVVGGGTYGRDDDSMKSCLGSIRPCSGDFSESKHLMIFG